MVYIWKASDRLPYVVRLTRGKLRWLWPAEYKWRHPLTYSLQQSQTADTQRVHNLREDWKIHHQPTDDLHKQTQC